MLAFYHKCHMPLGLPGQHVSVATLSIAIPNRNTKALWSPTRVKSEMSSCSQQRNALRTKNPAYSGSKQINSNNNVTLFRFNLTYSPVISTERKKYQNTKLIAQKIIQYISYLKKYFYSTSVGLPWAAQLCKYIYIYITVLYKILYVEKALKLITEIENSSKYGQFRFATHTQYWKEVQTHCRR